MLSKQFLFLLNTNCTVQASIVMSLIYGSVCVPGDFCSPVNSSAFPEEAAPPG